MAQFYGLAMPMVKRGIPVTPVQLENVTLPGFLDTQKILMLSYQGQKPQSADVHAPLAAWVKNGGVLVIADDDKDPYNQVREWWNDEGKTSVIPRQHLFKTLGIKDEAFENAPDSMVKVGKGSVIWLHESPVKFALSPEGDARLTEAIKLAAKKTGQPWSETNHLALKRGPYRIGAGLDECIPGEPETLKGRFVNLFDADLKLQKEITLAPNTRVFLLDLDAVKSKSLTLLASGCKALPIKRKDGTAAWTVEGVGDTQAIVLFSSPKAPKSVKLAGNPIDTFTYDPSEKLLHIRFPNESSPRELNIGF
jgi:hypothetical protein